jgi:MbtH protein
MDAFDTFTVVINHEEQFSIWPHEKDLPLGWKEVGKQGSKEECLAFIEENWVDMRPLSVRLSNTPGASN